MMRSPFKTAERSFSNLQSEVTGLLERLRKLGVSTGVLGDEFIPPVELREELDRYVLTAELPGVSLAMLEVAAGPSSITISGDKVKQIPPVTGTGEPVYPRGMQDERRYGRFTRTLALPGSILVDGVTASLAEGVLTVEMPKVAAPKPVEIRIEVSPAAPPSGTCGSTNMPPPTANNI